MESVVDCANPLAQSALDGFPFAAGQDSRQQVVGKNALGALVVTVDGKGHALVQKCAVRILLATPELGGRQLEQAAMQRRVRLSRHACTIEHLVVAMVERVFGEEIAANAQ